MLTLADKGGREGLANVDITFHLNCDAANWYGECYKYKKNKNNKLDGVELLVTEPTHANSTHLKNPWYNDALFFFKYVILIIFL